MYKGLIIDKDKTERQRLTKLLLSTGVINEVIQVATLYEAKKQLNNQYFNLIFLELNFSDGKAIDLIRTKTSHNHESNFIVYTTHFNDENIFPTLYAGAYGYLLKNQADDELTQHMFGILNGNPPFSPSITKRIMHYFRKIPIEQDNIGLTNKEKEVLTLIAKGISRSDTASLLNITDNTAASYIKNIYRKLNISSRAEATHEAIRIGLVQTNY